MADKKIEDAIIVIAQTMGNTPEAVRQLIDLTNDKSGVQFISIKGYNSDDSLHTEVANHLVNINAKYETMLDKDALTLASPNEMIKDEFLRKQLNWNYNRYDLAGVPIEIFRGQVIACFDEALEAKQKSKTEPTERVSNDVWLNGALVFNLTTLRLSVFGTSLNKEVKQEGIFKIVKSKPLTVAKQIIDKCTEMTGAKLRRFAIDNLNGLKMQGETIELGGGQKEGIEMRPQ